MMNPRKYERVVFNISGDVYETYRDTLVRFPESLLGDIDKIQRYYSTSLNQYFFDRCRLCFGAILYFYQSNGTLHCPLEVNLDVFAAECEFYQIPDEVITKMKHREGKLPEMDMEYLTSSDNVSVHTGVWDFMEYSNSSNVAKWYTIISSIFICVSILTSCLETMPDLNTSNYFLNDPWGILELCLNSWFLLELLLRFVLSRRKYFFLNSLLNWIDILTVLPYFLLLFSGDHLNKIRVLSVLRVFRVMRLFRMSKYSKRLKVVGEIVKSSVPDFQLLILCLGIVVIFGGSMMFFLEKIHPSTDFKSIPDSLWWAIQTITTVGYGDIIPQTLCGRVLSAGYSAFGVLTISLPILAIVAKFTLFYVKNVDHSPKINTSESQESLSFH